MSSSHRPQSQRTERDDTNTSILKNRKLGTDAVQQKKNALTQEFKELFRERNVKVAEEKEDVPKPKEHKLRQALDGLLGENKRRDTRLNELKLRLNIMRRDDISAIEPSERSVVGSDSGKKMSRFEPGSESKIRDGRDLVDKFAYVKQSLETILNRKEEEEEIYKMLNSKINELLRDQKVMTDRIGKKEALYDMMEKRFLNLGNAEFAAKNKLTRTSNKLLSLKQEMEKQKTHEEDYFKLKRTAFKRTQSAVEGFKDTIARNLIYLEEIRLKKDEVDEKLEEVTYEEKQIISKRQASEYILLYIDLLESLENEYLKRKTTPPKVNKKEPKLNYDTSPKEKPKSLLSAGTEETPKKLSEPSRPGSQTMDLDKRGQNSSDTTRDRDVIITRIAQFYDQHPSGTNALVQTLLKIYHDMLLNEQSLSIRHQDLNHERLERQAEIEELEKALIALQQGFILMEEKPDDTEEASPEHIRETERKVAGKLAHYDYKTVKLGEYLVNLCATGIQDTLSKLAKASCSLATKAGKRISGELTAKAKDIEASLSVPKSDFSVPEVPVRMRSISKAEDVSGKDTSISIRPRTISLSTSSPKESVINLHNLQKPEPIDERRDTSSSREDPGKIGLSQQTVSGGEEFNKVEQLFRSCMPNASAELVYKWNEKVFEAKWMLDYLTKEDIKRVLNKYSYYYGSDISEELLRSIIRDLKNEARLTQRKKTSEAFTMTEELLTLFVKHYTTKKNDLRKRYDTEIKSEVLDDLNQVLAVSEYVEKAHNSRYQNLFSEQQTEEPDMWRKAENRRDSESEMELVSLRAKTPEIKNMKTTREAIADLHNHYLKERRGLASSSGRRSNSVPKFKVAISRTRKESFDSSDGEEVIEDLKGSYTGSKRLGSAADDKKDMVIDSSMSRKKDGSSARRNSRASTEIEGEVTEEDRDGVKKSIVKKVDLAPLAKEKKVYPIPQAFYRAQQKSRNVEEFKKKLIKDEEILRKIALLEKRQTGFDKKSKDYDKRRDYVPNFSLLEKFDLNREKKRDQIIQEWWKRQEAGILDTTDRGRTSATFLISSARKDERQSWKLDQQTDSTRNILASQKRRLSKSTAKPWILPEEPGVQSSRPGTGSHGSQGKISARMRRDSFDDIENKLFKDAVSQNQVAVRSEIEKL